ncbi:hypothetical protein [Xanthomonas sp. 3075]|uniref:hypothetical protein n=1 Tax=Xanthomonas sp. 3075 TaxID=3035315 RepID=UPI001617942D|nr:hypothetical protein [Xanthomonas sp. 3075]MBB4132609.1 hypothetical protein [Xanthomonas sp. 3075]
MVFNKTAGNWCGVLAALSTPKLPESEQIRLWDGIHAAQGPAMVRRQGLVGMIGVHSEEQ